MSAGVLTSGGFVFADYFVFNMANLIITKLKNCFFFSCIKIWKLNYYLSNKGIGFIWEVTWVTKIRTTYSSSELKQQVKNKSSINEYFSVFHRTYHWYRTMLFSYYGILANRQGSFWVGVTILNLPWDCWDMGIHVCKPLHWNIGTPFIPTFSILVGKLWLAS